MGRRKGCKVLCQQFFRVPRGMLYAKEYFVPIGIEKIAELLRFSLSCRTCFGILASPPSKGGIFRRRIKKKRHTLSIKPSTSCKSQHPINLGSDNWIVRDAEKHLND